MAKKNQNEALVKALLSLTAPKIDNSKMANQLKGFPQGMGSKQGVYNLPADYNVKNEIKDAALFANSFAPVTGDIQSGVTAAQDFSKGNYGMAALNAIGLLPFVPSMGAAIKNVGKSAKTEFELAHELAQQRAALPVSEGGLGLPATNTAMDRAKALGFDINNPAYHGTTKDISAFDVNASRGKGFNTGSNVTDNPYLADTYTMGINSGNVMPLYIKDNPAMVVEAGGKNWNRLGQSTKVKAPTISVIDKETDDLLVQLGVESNNNPVVKKGFSKTLKKMFPDEFLFDDYFSTDDLARFARNQGYGSAKFNDIVDIGSSGMMFTEKAGLPSNNQVIFDPSLIRSRFAAFDPFKRNEADILAGVGVGLPVSSGLFNNQDKNKK